MIETIGYDNSLRLCFRCFLSSFTPMQSDERHLAPLAAQSVGTVLVADDEPLVRGALVAILRRAGYTCHEAADAETAVDIVQQGDCDALVVDIHMPGNSGLEMVRRLAEMQPGLPLILVTGQPAVETAAQAVRFNVLGYLIKPVGADELLGLVQRGVDAARLMRHLRSRRSQLEQLAGDIRRFEEAGQRLFRQDGADALQTYLALSMEHILGSVADLRRLMEAVIQREGAERVSERLAGSRPLLLLNAVHEAVHVLEQTKGSFKSRELGELRRKLEQLLATAQSRPAPQGEISSNG